MMSERNEEDLRDFGRIPAPHRRSCFHECLAETAGSSASVELRIFHNNKYAFRGAHMQTPPPTLR